MRGGVLQPLHELGQQVLAIVKPRPTIRFPQNVKDSGSSSWPESVARDELIRETPALDGH